MKIIALAAILALHLPVPGAAQEVDTTTKTGGSNPLIAVGLAVATAITLFAPPVYLLVPPDSGAVDPAQRAFRSKSILMYGSVGVTGLLKPGSKGGADWAASTGVQVYYGHLLADARVDEQGVDRAYQLQSAQLAYLFSGSNPRVAAGVSLGVQRVGRDRSRQAVTVGLPLVGFGSRSIWARLEPRYVFSPSGAEWHWRGELFGPVTRGSPLILGGSVEMRPIPERGRYHGILSFIVGVRP